jgi:hypothetical protein
MNESHPAWKLAEGARSAVASANVELLEKAINPFPSADTIAQALALSLTTHPFIQYDAPRQILRDYLQVALTREHVAAQKRMGRTVNRLNVILVFLTAALVWFGYVDYSKQPHHNETGPLSTRTSGP